MKRGLTGSAVTACRSPQASDSHRKNVDCIIKKFLQWAQEHAIDLEEAHVDSIVSHLNPWRDQGKLSTAVATASAISTMLFAAHGRDVSAAPALVDAKELAKAAITRGEIEAPDLLPVHEHIKNVHEKMGSMNDAQLQTIVGFLLWAEHELRAQDLMRMPLAELGVTFGAIPRGCPLDEATEITLRVSDPKEQQLKDSQRRAWSAQMRSTHEPECKDEVHTKTRTHEWCAELLRRHRVHGNLPEPFDFHGRQVCNRTWAMPVTNKQAFVWIPLRDLKHDKGTMAIKAATLTKKDRKIEHFAHQRMRRQIEHKLSTSRIIRM